MADEVAQKDQEPPEQQAGWQFHNDENTSAQASSPKSNTDVKSIEWSASEFIEHSKSSGWYLLLILAGLGLAAIVYLLTKDEISAAMVIIVTIIFGVVAGRRPRVLNYQVDASGIHIGEKLYPYANFKSFSVVQEGGIDSIWLMPLKRFMPMLTIYFEPKDGAKIMDALSKFLPVEAHKLDAVDRLMHRLRF